MRVGGTLGHLLALTRLDAAIVSWLNPWARRSPAMRLVISCAARWLASVEVGLMVLLAVGGRRQEAVRMFAAVTTVYVCSELVGRAWWRARPFVELSGVEPLIEHAAGRSFPSRHVASGVAMAAIGARSHRHLGRAMEYVAYALGVSRVAAGVHYPSDMLAGVVLGRVVAAVFGRVQSPE